MLFVNLNWVGLGLFIKWSRTGPTRRPDRTGPDQGLSVRSSVLLFSVFGLRSGPGLDRVDRQLNRTEDLGPFFVCFRSRLWSLDHSASRFNTLYLCPLRIPLLLALVLALDSSIFSPPSPICSLLSFPLLSTAALLSLQSAASPFRLCLRSSSSASWSFSGNQVSVFCLPLLDLLYN